MQTDGTGIEQLTFDNRVNWFPTPLARRSPYRLSQLSRSTLGHPPDKEVLLRLMSPTGANQRDLRRILRRSGHN